MNPHESNSDRPEDIETSTARGNKSTKSTKPWVVRAWRWFERQWHLNPLRTGLGLGLATLVMSVLVLGIGTTVVERTEADMVRSIKLGTLSELHTQLDAGKIASLTSHSIREPEWLSSRTQDFTVVELNDKTQFALRSNLVMGETVAKAIHTQALKQNIDFKQGFNHRKGNLLMDGAMVVLNMTLLFFVLIVAQSIATELLVGKNFNLTTQDHDINFNDIIGYDDVKREFKEVVDQLRNAKAFAELGVTAPRGILLSGSPGVGKTMFAKALANECKAKFLYATGSDFVELYVGTGARRARAMFKQARLESPTVIFIDEIDALGSRDQWGMDSERQSTINQILSEMDGMSVAGQILVVGATNHPQKLDPALLRPGRFDKKIAIPNPDASTREGILTKHLRESGYDAAVDIKTLAARTAGTSGADLKNLVAEAKNLALRESGGTTAKVQQRHLDQAHEIVLLGALESEPSIKERERVAFHELGHALAAHELCDHLSVSKVAVGARGSALGFTMQLPIEERMLHTQDEMLSQICALLAGRAAEQALLGSISNGSSDDLDKASQIALRMVSSFGMGASNGLLASKPNQSNGEWSAAVQDDARAILTAQYARALELVEQRKDWIASTSTLLLERGSLSGGELFAATDSPPWPELGETA